MSSIDVVHCHAGGEVGDVVVAGDGRVDEIRVENLPSFADETGRTLNVRGFGAFITGTSNLRLDPADPWPEGYRLNDTWPDGGPAGDDTIA